MNGIIDLRAALRVAAAAAACIIISATAIAAQQKDALDERALDLIVMLTGELAAEPTAGAGIVFGGGEDRLFIVTANHVVRRGTHEAAGLRVQFRTHHELPLEARLTPHADPKLDLAVLVVEGVLAHGLPICDFPRDRLAHLDSLARGDEVYPVGYAHGIEWGMPLTADRLAGVRDEILTFQSVFIAKGHSGGALLTGSGTLAGLIRADEPPFGRAVHLGKVLAVLRAWGYPVQLYTRGALHRAAGQGRIDELRLLLAGGCGIIEERVVHYIDYSPIIDRYDDTALHEAAKRDQLEAVDLLLKHGAEVDAVSEFGTPLFRAVERGSSAIVNRLLAAGADPNGVSAVQDPPLQRAQDTPLQLAAQGAGDFYITAGRPQITPRWEVDGEIVRALLVAGADPNRRRNRWDWTPLHKAVGRGHVRIVELLLTAGADANASPDNLWITPLHYAASLQRLEIAKLLLEAGADVNARDRSDRTPLSIARSFEEGNRRECEEMKCQEMIDLLLAHGALQ